MTQWLARSRGQARLVLIVMLAASGVGLMAVSRNAATDPPRAQAELASGSSSGASFPSAVQLAAGGTVYLVTSAHAPGAAGSVWWTDLECHNPGSTSASYSIALLRHASDNSSPTTKSFTLDPGKSVRYPDIINNVFNWQNGKAALRVTVSSGSLLVTSRTYNNQPSGTYGQFVPAFPDADAITSADEGRLIQLTHQPTTALGSFRTNLGVVNATSSTIPVTIDLYRCTGAFLGQVPLSLKPFDYQQVDRVTEGVSSSFLDDVYAIVRTSAPSGRFFAYASVIDNKTSDPIFVPASRMPKSSSSPTPTPTTPPPTPTPTHPSGSTANLAVYTPQGWANCVVCNYREVDPPVTELLSTYYPAYTYFSLVNLGTATFTGPVTFAFSLDGAEQFRATWPNSGGLQANYYVTFDPLPVTVATAGHHSIQVRIDPANAIPETTKSDNACSFAGDWTTILFAPPQPARAPAAWGHATIKSAGPFPLERAVPGALAANQTLYIPTSAHAPGAAGSVWWTDLECHNPGSTSASYSIALLRHASDNSSPTTKSFTLDPGKSVRYPDIINNVFNWQNGKAALRVTVSSGSLLVTSRTYNNQPSGTYGQFVPAFPDADAITSADEGRLIQLTHQPTTALGSFRTNLGVVNATSSTIPVTIDLYRCTGAFLGQVPLSLKPFDYQQVDRVTEGVSSSFLDDVYAIVRTSAPSGRFFAYASVIDNKTSDPIFVPASRMPKSSSSPTPTPTTPPPTPTPTSPPSANVIGAYEAATDIFNGLGKLGTGNIPSLEQIVHTVQSSGVDALNASLADRYPTIVTIIPNGIRANFGTGTTLPSGVVLSGSATATYSNLVRSSSKVSLNFAASSTNLAKNGALLPLTSATGSVNLNIDSSGHLIGDTSVNAQGSTSQGPVSLSGSAHVDTTKCKNYPVSGSVTVNDNGITKTITFNDKCDGSFIYDGPGLKYVDFQPYWTSACGGSAETSVYHFVIDNGRFLPDSYCPADSLHNVTFSGSLTGTEMHIQTSQTNPAGRPWIHATFVGTNTPNYPTTFNGTMSWQVTNYNGDGSVKCTDSGSQPLYEILLPTSYCQWLYNSPPSTSDR